jgi:hypothetical protein
MACTSFPTVVVQPPRPRYDLRSLLTALSATLFSVAYTGFVLLEATRPACDGSLALHVVGLGFSFVASFGGWGALLRTTWGLALALLAARGNLFLLTSAIALAVWDASVGQAPRDPIVVLAALGALQAVTVILSSPAFPRAAAHLGG